MFPLYYTLNKTIKKKDLTKEEKQFIIECINNFTDECINIFFYLIFEHYKNCCDKEININNLPYNIQYDNDDCNKGNVILEINDLPFELRQIIFKFCNISKKDKFN